MDRIDSRRPSSPSIFGGWRSAWEPLAHGRIWSGPLKLLLLALFRLRSSYRHNRVRNAIVVVRLLTTFRPVASPAVIRCWLVLRRTSWNRRRVGQLPPDIVTTNVYAVSLTGGFMALTRFEPGSPDSEFDTLSTRPPRRDS